MRLLAAHLDEPWRSYLRRGRIVHPHTDTRTRSRPHAAPSGDSPGSDPRFTIEDHIERHEIDYAVLIGEPTQLEISNLANAEAAAALSAAYNDRLIETWLCPWITATLGRSTPPPRQRTSPPWKSTGSAATRRWFG